MRSIVNQKELRERIAELEEQKTTQEAELRTELQSSYRNLKPAYLFRSLVDDIVETPEVIQDILTNLMSIASGYVSKKLIVRKKGGPGRKFIGTLLQYGMTYYVASHAQEIKERGKALFNQFFNKITDDQSDESEGT